MGVLQADTAKGLQLTGLLRLLSLLLKFLHFHNSDEFFEGWKSFMKIHLSLSLPTTTSPPAWLSSKMSKIRRIIKSKYHLFLPLSPFLSLSLSFSVTLVLTRRILSHSFLLSNSTSLFSLLLSLSFTHSECPFSLWVYFLTLSILSHSEYRFSL